MRFEPFVFIQTSEKRPSSIAVAGWTANQMKYMTLPESSTEESLAQVQAIVRSHFFAHTGQCHLYGNITGFRFVLSPTESIVLDTDGSELWRESGNFWPKSISMEDDVVVVEK
jgi:hypothetical protein